MANCFIGPLYKKVYGENFDYGDFGKRMKMQKCIYLIEQLGLNVGGYDFSWYKHGPYSQRLQDDMYIASGLPSAELQYSDFAISVLDKVKSIVEKSRVSGFNYTEEHWMECLASIHYLNRMFQGDREKTLSELSNRKPHLNDTNLNNVAYDLINSF